MNTAYLWTPHETASCNCEHRTLMCTLLPAVLSQTANSHTCQFTKSPIISLLLQNKARVHNSCKTEDTLRPRRGKDNMTHLREALCDYVMWVALDHECFHMRAYVLTVTKLPILLLQRSLFRRYDFCSNMERTFRLLSQQRK